MTKGNNVHMKEDGYTWKDLDRSYWEGFDDAKNKMEKRIAELEQQIEKMKCDVKQEQSYWNSSEMQYGLFQRLLDKWEIK